MRLSQQELADQINAHALAAYPGLLEEWFPAGRRKGLRFVVGDLGGDRKGESVSINISTGAWKEFSGGPGGYDAIGLFAHAKCGGDRKTAFRVLGNRFGLLEGSTPQPNVKPRPKLVVVAREDWKSIVPPPADAGLPVITGAAMVHEYRMPGVDFPVRYVARIEKPDGTKIFVPHTYGTLDGVTGWHKKHPQAPMCLYGLKRLGGCAVILQEGEHKADLLQEKLPGYACLGWSGGGNMVENHDFHPLSRSAVTIVGDAGDGVEPMMKAADIIHRLGEALGDTVLGGMVRTVDTSMFPKGWDLGNAVTGRMVKKGKVVWEDPDGPWPAEKIEAFIHENARLYDPDPGNVDPESPPDDDAEWKDDSSTPDKRTLPPIPLGYDSGHYYYLSPMTGQIEVLARRSHTKQELIGIADLQWYERLEQFKGDKGGLDWDKIGNFLKGCCSDVGFYRPGKVRGRGAWMDEGRAVFNLGNRLLVDGESLPLKLPGSRYFYEAAVPLDCVVADPLTSAQAGEVLKLCKLFSWEKPIYGTLVAGWLATAVICGALFWRPGIWVIGGSGSGKSTLEKLIVEALLGDIGLFKKGGSTEAGIRQQLGRDALPVILDEAEAESAKSKATLQGILELNRQSSSEGGAEIVKGTQNQTGAKKYLVRSSFYFSSINPMLDHQADESRITVVGLMRHNAEARAGFDAFVDRITETITPEFRAGFIARSVWLMPVILDNARTFSRAVSAHLGSSRVGDQIGTLLAGAFSEISDNRISPEAARKWVQEQDWDGMTSADSLTDEQRLLNHLMQRRVRVDLADLTLAEIVGMASDEPPSLSGQPGQYQKELLRNGLKYEDGGVWISNSHTALKKHLEGTPWSSQWARTLRRLPGTKPLNREEPGIKFAGELARATFVPFDLIGG